MCPAAASFRPVAYKIIQARLNSKPFRIQPPTPPTSQPYSSLTFSVTAGSVRYTKPSTQNSVPTLPGKLLWLVIVQALLSPPGSLATPQSHKVTPPCSQPSGIIPRTFYGRLRVLVTFEPWGTGARTLMLGLPHCHRLATLGCCPRVGQTKPTEAVPPGPALSSSVSTEAPWAYSPRSTMGLLGVLGTSFFSRASASSSDRWDN